MTRFEDDESMRQLLAKPPERVWFYEEDAVWYAVSERVAMAMSRMLVGPYVLERDQ